MGIPRTSPTPRNRKTCSLAHIEEFSVVDENKPRRIYNSFLIRYWRFLSDQRIEQSYFEVEHIQSGERRRVKHLIDAQPWMEEAGRTEPPANNDED
jgi:hypothetical protein